VKRIAIFASGNGSNAQRIVEYFSGNKEVEINLILTNNSSAGVLKRAATLDVEAVIFNKNDFVENAKVHNLLKDHKIDFIVLAGFLWLIPSFLINNYPDRIVNIHPALLPKYGGKGMYGMRVHESVIANGEKQSGISIHLVNKKYDEGQIIFQATVDIEEGETAGSLADKIHGLEYEHFPKTIEKVLKNI